MYLKGWLLSLLILLIVVWGVVSIRNKTPLEDIKSINLSTDYEIDQVLEDIELLQVNTVNVPIAIQIPDLTSNELSVIDYSEQRAIELIKILKKRGIKVILEPFPWISNGSEYETAYAPADTNLFFEKWQDILMYLIDNIATPYKVDAMIVGSNFTLLEQYEQQWCDLIDNIHEKFHGLVTYKTSWWYTAQWDDETHQIYEAKLTNELFSKVDFISIAAYFELSGQRENTVEELVEAIYATKLHDRQQNVEAEISN
ncbi:MAG TPA: hydrolase, partial [Firmicutes bacterium]|nr:hydrolase [Bacillota bacterium]